MTGREISLLEAIQDVISSFAIFKESDRLHPALIPDYRDSVLRQIFGYRRSIEADEKTFIRMMHIPAFHSPTGQGDLSSCIYVIYSNR